METRLLRGRYRAWPMIPMVVITSRSHHTLLRPYKRQFIPTTSSLYKRLSIATFTTIPYSNTDMSKFYELKAEKPNGTTFNLSELKGKVVLIVNVASQWCISYDIRLRDLC